MNAELKYVILCLLALVLGSRRIGADNVVARGYNISTLDLKQGLPNNNVNSIFEDSFGFLWICTHGGGLVRFDGYEYLSYSNGVYGSLLRSNSCRNLCEDRSQRLWIAYDDYVSVLDLRLDTEVTPAATTQALALRLRALMRERSIRTYCDRLGRVWIATLGNIYCLSFDDRGRVAAISQRRVSINAPDVAMLDLSADGWVCLGTNNRVALWRPRGQGFDVRDCSSQFAPLQGTVNDLITYRGHLWVATTNGLYCNDARRTVLWGGAGPQSLPHSYVSSLCRSPRGFLLAGTLSGVGLIQGQHDAVLRWNTQSEGTPLNSDFVNSIYSHNGIVWIGTATGGLEKLLPRRLQLVNYNHNSLPGSISPHAVNAIYTEPNGTLWVGTVEGGLNRKAPGQTTFTHLTTHNSQLPHNSVSALTQGSGHTLWIGTWGGGVCSLQTDRPQSVTRLEPVPRELSADLLFVGALQYDARNRGLWIGCNSGLFFYSLDRLRLEMPFAQCRDIHGCIGSVITRDGWLYMGCLDGMVMVNLKSRRGPKGYFAFRHVKYKLDNPATGIVDKITAMCQQRDGTLWLGSGGYGLYRQQRDARGTIHYKAYMTSDGLANNVVKGIVEDPSGSLWITTDHGLSHFDPRTELFTNYYESDGLLSSQFYFNSACISPQGRLYFGTDRGLVEMLPQVKAPQSSTPLRFTQLSVDNAVAMPGGGHLDNNIAMARRINLHESNKSMTISFASLDYGSQNEGSYSYRLEGYEDRWIRLQPGQHSVRYSGLPAGNYRFQVRYLSTLTNGKDKEASIEVHVTPYFYKSWWFVTLCILCSLAGARWLYRRRLRQLHEAEVENLYRPIEEALRESNEPGALQERIQNIINNSRKYHISLDKTLNAEKENKEKTFMERVIEVIEQHYEESDFGIQQMADDLKMSATMMSRKLKGETGFTASQYLKNYRLDVARRMIEEGIDNLNITEVAWRVGFNDPKYFTRCFTHRYNISPSAFAAEKSKKAASRPADTGSAEVTPTRD